MGLKAAVLPDNDATNPVRIHWFPDPPGNDPLKNRFARTSCRGRLAVDPSGEAALAPLKGELGSPNGLTEGFSYALC